MNSYTKSSLIGVSVYLIIHIVACIMINKPGTSIVASASDSFLLCIFLGPFMWIPLLIYPGIFIIAIFVVLRGIKYNISPSLISSSIIFYSIGLLLAQHGFEIFKRGTESWKLMLIAAISCFLGFLYAKFRTPNKKVEQRVAK
jgi:hypothetical protein